MPAEPLVVPFDVLGPTVRVYDAITARLAALPASAFPRPERSYVTLGDIDFPTTCAQLAVAARQVYAGAPGAQRPGPITPTGGYQEFSLEIGVAYTRCWPLPKGGKAILPPEQEDGAARALLAECGQVVSAVVSAHYAGELKGPCSDASVGPVTFLGPQGGVAGVTVVVAIQLN